MTSEHNGVEEEKTDIVDKDETTITEKMMKLQKIQQLQRQKLLEQLIKQTHKPQGVAREKNIIKKPDNVISDDPDDEQPNNANKKRFESIKLFNENDLLMQCKMLENSILLLLNDNNTINIDKASIFFQNLLNSINTYNNEIISWNDQKFNDDKQQLFKSIHRTDEKINKFTNIDYISFL